MAPKRKKKLHGGPTAKELKSGLVGCKTTIKLSLRKSLKKKDEPKGKSTEPKEKSDEPTEQAEAFRTMITEQVLNMTRIMKLGSLNLHLCLRELMSSNDDEQIEAHFIKRVDQQFFGNFFRAITENSMEKFKKQEEEETNEDCLTVHKKVKVYSKLKQFMDTYDVPYPKSGEFYENSYQHAMIQYMTNFENNIAMHAWSRMQKFLFLYCHDRDQVIATLKYLFYEDHDEDKVNWDLIEAIKEHLKPIEFGTGAAYFYNIRERWYRTVPMFMIIQR